MERARAIQERLAERELAALIVSAPANVRWLTGYTGSNGLAIVGPGRENTFFTDFRYREQIREQLDPGWTQQIETDLTAAAMARLAELQSGRPLRVGFDDEHTSVATLRTMEQEVDEDVVLVPAGGIVEAARAIKDAAEVEAIRHASAIADAAFEEVIGGGIVGRTEVEVALDLELAMRRRGADGVAFSPIVAGGAHGALPHAEPRDVPIEAGVLVTVDWGAHADGYCSDCTRTVATGPIGEELVAIYELVLAAEQAGVAAVRAGLGGREVDGVARAVIDEAGHGDHFGHGLGHGVGVEVHEGPRLSARSTDTLAAGQVVTVEPGVYVPGLGGVRIEDLVVVTGDGCEVITTLPRQLRTVT